MSKTKNHPLIGKTITAVHLAADNQALRFDVEGAEPIVARTEDDCCSYTWVESLDNVDALIGGTVAAVEDIDMPELGYDHEEYDVLAFYGCRITTDKGHCTIDYRNDSNGYYGGSLIWSGSYHYGGVFNQNVSKEEWRQLKPEDSTCRS